MKKSAFLVLLMSFVMVTCKKAEYSEKEIQKDLLIEQVSDIVDLCISPGVPDDFTVINCNNPFDAAGIITGEITYDILTKARGKRSAISMLKTRCQKNVLFSLLLKQVFYWYYLLYQ